TSSKRDWSSDVCSSDLVMLVLLIIFMVAAPLATVDIAVNLPASTAEPKPRPDLPLFLTVKSDLTLALGEQPVPRERFRSTIDQEIGRATSRERLESREG